jgi:hypothetical protein
MGKTRVKLNDSQHNQQPTPDNRQPGTINSHQQTQTKININPRQPTQQPKGDKKHKKIQDIRFETNTLLHFTILFRTEVVPV